MARTLFLLVLLLIRSNAYAWYCSYTPSPEGWVTNLQCHDISNAEALRIAWCPYRPQDPICGTLAPPEPVCVATTESQSLACPVHYSGVINQSRTYQCSSQSWGAWTTTSNNCTPDPPSCHTSMEERQVACSEGYTGTITEQRSSQCPDPYGQPIFGAWQETQNTCQKSITNPTNVSSPLNPSSPIAAPPPEPPAPEPPPVMNMESPAGIAPPPPPPPPPQEAPKEVKSSGSVNTSSSPTVASPTEQKETKVETKVEVPKGKELVPGFGLVMSLDILNKPMQMQQQKLQINLDYSQELPIELRGNQDFLLQLLTDNNVGDSFRSRNDRLWGDLRRHNDLQPCYSCD